MNIILFTDADVFAGTERHILDLAVALTGLGHSVTVACPVPAPLADRARQAGIRVLPVAKRRMPDFAAIRTLAAELRAGRVDIIHAHNGRTHLLAVAAVKRAGRGSVVATQHFLAPNRTGRRGPKAALANRLHRWAEYHTAAFVAISNAVKDQMLKRGDAPAEKITVVHNGTVEPEVTAPERIAALRRELGVVDRPMVFCAARLQKEKDIPTLIRAFAALRSMNDGENSEPVISNLEAIPNPGSPKLNAKSSIPVSLTIDNTDHTANTDQFLPSLFIAGDGDQRAECERAIASMMNDGAKNAEPGTWNLEGKPASLLAAASRHAGTPIENTANTANIANTANTANTAHTAHTVNTEHTDITLLGFRSDVSALMSACDIFVLPAPAEPFGLVLIEAMALGKPVIAAAAGGPLEIVADGETGLLFEPGNAESLSSAIRRLLADPDLRRRMGIAGRKRYAQKFTARRMAENMQQVYAGGQRGEL